MPWKRADWLLYVAILASAYYAYHTVPDTLNHIRNLAACPEPVGPGPKKQLQKDAENAIAIDTLKALSDGHSYDLRASTIKIVAHRTLRSRTKKLLLEDLASNDSDRRDNAIHGLRMLISHQTLYGKHIQDQFMNHQTFKAIVTSLKHNLADHNSEEPREVFTQVDLRYPTPKLPPSPVRPTFRPHQERILLAILNQLMEATRSTTQGYYIDNITCALHAGLITQWLKDYPFPCALPSNAKFNAQKSDVFSFFRPIPFHDEDPDEMDYLFNKIGGSALGKQQLIDVGLRRPSYPDSNDMESVIRRWEHFPTRFDATNSDNDIHMVNGESTAGAATPPPVPLRRRQRSSDDGVPLSRPQELSPEEENLRRRRREAVVIAEPGAAFDQYNILQRVHSD